MKKKITAIVICLVLVCSLCLVACDIDLTKTGSTNKTITVTDMMGRELEVPLEPQKVVCIGAGALRLYTYIGDLSKLCAVEEIEATRTTQRISLRPYQIANEDLFVSLVQKGATAGAGGPNAQSLSAELIETLSLLSPDIVFSCLTTETTILENAEKAIGCPIVTLKYGEQKAFSQELLQSLSLLVTICNKKQRSAELASYIKNLKVDLLARGLENSSAKIYLACNSNWGVKGFLSTAKSYPIFTASYITNVMDSQGITLQNGFADMEAVINSGADKIILDAGGLETFKADYLAQDSLLPQQLEGMAAFKNKEVYLIMPNNAYDANVETYFINAYYALSVACGVEIDIEAKAKEITKQFLGVELYDEITMYGGYQKLNLPEVWPEK